MMDGGGGSWIQRMILNRAERTQAADYTIRSGMLQASGFTKVPSQNAAKEVPAIFCTVLRFRGKSLLQYLTGRRYYGY